MKIDWFGLSLHVGYYSEIGFAAWWMGKGGGRKGDNIATPSTDDDNKNRR